MSEKPNALSALGLEMSLAVLRGASLSFQKGNPILNKLLEFPLVRCESAGENVKPLYIPEGDALSKLTKLNGLIVTALDTNEVLIRPLEVKLFKEVDINSVLSFQAEPLLPYPIDTAIVDKIKIKQNKDEGTSLSLLAVKKDHVAQHLEKWHALNIEPEMVSCTPAALAAFATLFSDISIPLLILHIQESVISCVLIKEGKLISAYSALNGVDSLVQAYAKDQSGDPSALRREAMQLDFMAIDAATMPHMAEALEALRLDVTRLLYALTKYSKGSEGVQLMFTGEGADYHNFEAYLAQNISQKIINPQPTANFTASTADFKRFAVPIGLALTALPKGPDAVDFRQGELTYPNPWKRFKRPIGIYFGLCLLLSFALYLYGQSYLGYKEDGLKEQYISLLDTMHKPYQAFESEYETKFPSGRHEALPPIKLSQDDIAGRLRYLEKELQGTPDMFPLLPNVPRVSDVLAWLGSQAVHLGENTKEKIDPNGLQLDSFSYTMVKRPEQNKKQEKYQIKVELEITSPTPKMAREFHDALIAPNDLVDPKGEVKWSSNRGKYRTSFFLKDKTTYPSTIH
jgi:type IV pilus assembly protein PilM